MKYAGRKHMRAMHCTSGKGRGGLKPIVEVKIEERVIDKKYKTIQDVLSLKNRGGARPIVKLRGEYSNDTAKIKVGRVMEVMT